MSTKSESPKPGQEAKDGAATRVVSYDRGHTRGDVEGGAPVMAAMGYQQELKRNLSMWTALGLGASIIAAPFGLSTSAAFSLVNGAWK